MIKFKRLRVKQTSIENELKERKKIEKKEIGEENYENIKRF